MSDIIALAKMLEDVSKSQVLLVEKLGKIVIDNASNIEALAKQSQNHELRLISLEQDKASL